MSAQLCTVLPDRYGRAANKKEFYKIRAVACYALVKSSLRVHVILAPCRCEMW